MPPPSSRLPSVLTPTPPHVPRQPSNSHGRSRLYHHHHHARRGESPPPAPTQPLTAPPATRRCVSTEPFLGRRAVATRLYPQSTALLRSHSRHDPELRAQSAAAAAEYLASIPSDDQRTCQLHSLLRGMTPACYPRGSPLPRHPTPGHGRPSPYSIAPLHELMTPSPYGIAPLYELMNPDPRALAHTAPSGTCQRSTLGCLTPGPDNARACSVPGRPPFTLLLHAGFNGRSSPACSTPQSAARHPSPAPGEPARAACRTPPQTFAPVLQPPHPPLPPAGCAAPHGATPHRATPLPPSERPCRSPVTLPILSGPMRDGPGPTRAAVLAPQQQWGSHPLTATPAGHHQPAAVLSPDPAATPPPDGEAAGPPRAVVLLHGSGPALLASVQQKMAAAAAVVQPAPPTAPKAEAPGPRARLWAKTGMSVFRGGGKQDGRASGLIAALQEKDHFSLVQGARSRMRKFAGHPPGAGKEGGGGAPKKPISAAWLAILNGIDFSKLHVRVQQMLQDDAHSEGYCGSYGSISRMRKRLEQQKAELMSRNPAAFQENTALDHEAEYRALAERAALRLKELQEGGCVHGVDSSARNFNSALQQLRFSRPFFAGPQVKHEERQRAADGGPPKKKAWVLDLSFFAQRKKECEAKSCLDRDRVLAHQFDLDWRRVISKARFRKMVARGDAGVSDASELERELGEVRAELFRNFTTIRQAFLHFSCLGGNTDSASLLQMSLVQYIKFTQDCAIADNHSVGCKAADLDTIFISTNFEEEAGTQESDANDDNALCRFEFLEVIVRIAFAKYITPKEMDDSSDAVTRLLEECMMPKLHGDALADPNQFRIRRFYTEDMEVVLLQNLDLLQAVFRVYKAKDKTKYFWIEHWIALLESLNMFGNHTGLDKFIAKAIFCWSQMTVSDELKRRQRAVSLTFFDFLEALARLAEVLSLQPAEGLRATFGEGSADDNAAGLSLVWQHYKHEIGRAKATAFHANTGAAAFCFEACWLDSKRMLHEKFGPFLELLASGLRVAWGGANTKQLVQRLNRMAAALSGGIELG